MTSARLRFRLPLLAALLLFTIPLPSAAAPPEKDYSFGLIADCQYCSVEGTGVRKYSMSDQKLIDAVSHLNRLKMKFTVHLGDFIDRDAESLDIVGPIYDKLKAPGYHVLGNHDFSVADSLKEGVPLKMGMPGNYYAIEIKGPAPRKARTWRFIILDGNDISFYAYSIESDGYRKAETYYHRNNPNAPKWNGAIGNEQLAWLEDELAEAKEEGQNVVLLCHFPVYPENIHNLWNAPEVLAIIDAHPVVKAWVNGHNHTGNYATRNGVHYLTLKGMVDTEETSYAIIDVYDDRLVLTGVGREEDRVMSILSGRPDSQ